MNNITKPIFIFLLALVLLTAPAIVSDTQAQTGGDFDLSWSSMDSGGGSSSGGDFEVEGVTGQPDSSARSDLTGGSYTLAGGFWYRVTSSGGSGGGDVSIYLPIIVKN